MPELADVEGFRRYLVRHAKGRGITGVVVSDATLLRNTAIGAFRRAVTGRRFAAPGRHGKWLLAPMDGPTRLMQDLLGALWLTAPWIHLAS